jgi:hypothetical protein
MDKLNQQALNDRLAQDDMPVSSNSNPFELTMAQQLALENFTRGVRETDPEWVQALAIDLYRQLFIHKNLFNAHLKGDF